MTATSRSQGLLARLPKRLHALFNLNDPGWGREPERPAGSGSQDEQPGQARPGDGDAPTPPRPQGGPPLPPPTPQRPTGGKGQEPPDLSELMGDLSQKLGKLLGNGGNGNSGGRGQPTGPRRPAISGSLIATGGILLAALWLGTGFFIVQEGHRGVVTLFGKYQNTVGAGLNWRWPTPIGRHEMVDMRIKTMDIGSGRTLPETGLNEYAMLTQDENIIEVLFTVQYRINNAEQWLFNTQNQLGAIAEAAESAVREVVGKMSMDQALADRREDIAPALRKLTQEILERYQLGVEVVAINMQPSGVRPPDMVRAAFDDVLRADQERERLKNDAEAYANKVVPLAVGEAARMVEEAEGYREQITARAEGDAARFNAVLAEYRKAPQVTRERMYLETMEDVYGKSRKVLVDSGSSSNLMYLPLDKWLESPATATGAPALQAPPAAAQDASAQTAPAAQASQRRPGRDIR